VSDDVHHESILPAGPSTPCSVDRPRGTVRGSVDLRVVRKPTASTRRMCSECLSDARVAVCKDRVAVRDDHPFDRQYQEAVERCAKRRLVVDRGGWHECESAVHASDELRDEHERATPINTNSQLAKLRTAAVMVMWRTIGLLGSGVGR
jgi:hypothetical protein